MRKRKNRQKNPVTTTSKQPHTKKTRTWRDFTRSGIIAVLLLSVTGIGIAAYKRNYEITHDLSVIGQGKPVIVQIHDPSCQLCQRLKRNTSDALGPLNDDLLYRIADINTPEGKRLQRQHEVPHVTLLLFDRNGKVRNVLTGVKDEDVLQRAFKVHLRRYEEAQRKSVAIQESNS